MTEPIKNKYFVFSDESGSWHESGDVYVRSWVVVHESDYPKLIEAVRLVISELGANELKWGTIAGNKKYWDLVSKFDFRVFLTVSSVSDILWEKKYRITRNFPEQIETLDFGEIDQELKVLLKKKIFDDIKNVLFLKFYEKTHIENAKLGIDRVLPKRENLLVYRVDPPQMSHDGWKRILLTISPGVQIEFPKSHTDEGIQFADIIAGCVRSFLILDKHQKEAEKYIRMFRSKIISKNTTNPNPNLIFFSEINDTIKERSGKIWTI